MIFDTETSGLPDRAGFDKNYPPWAIAHYAKCRVIQLAYQIYEMKRGRKHMVLSRTVYIRPNGFIVPPDAVAIHGITMAVLEEKGVSIVDALAEFAINLKGCVLVVGHNVDFDKNAMAAEAWRAGMSDLAATITAYPAVCTMRASKEFCGALNDRGDLKMPRLAVLYQKIYGREPDNQHDAMGDVIATADCYFHLRDMGLVI